jgi:septal ring factor EnvC (AmiA/AmiB activator)
MDAHTRLAESLEGQIAILEEKKAELETVLAMKNESLKEQEAVSADLARLGKEQSSILDKLKKQSSKVKAEINKKQQELNKLNKRIDAEIERVLAEERAAKKRAEEAAKKKNAASGSGSGSKNSSNKASVFADDAGVAEMTGSFLKNKKKMPVPITGPYLVVDEYGTKNVIEGKGNVQIDNKGVILEGSKGAQARCIFEGRVTAVVNDGNYHFVLIRHGEYISVYCNIVNMRVSGGEKVKAGEVIGDIGIDAKSGTPRMQFQLRKEKQTLNPAEWIRM